jgi:hypothetical protein
MPRGRRCQIGRGVTTPVATGNPMVGRAPICLSAIFGLAVKRGASEIGRRNEKGNAYG